jgi:hypothetical protein
MIIDLGIGISHLNIGKEHQFLFLPGFFLSPVLSIAEIAAPKPQTLSANHFVVSRIE